MTKPRTDNKWLTAFFALILAGSFFIPWVNWAGVSMPGYAMPAGEFFNVSATKFGLSNPYPKLEFTFYIFWLIPAAAIAALFLAVMNKKTGLAAGIAGALSLSLAVVYILFTNILLQLGVGKSLLSSLSFGIYLTIISALGLILAGIAGRKPVKAFLIVGPPIIVWLVFTILSKQLEGEKYDDTAGVESAYTVYGPDLIHEFKNNDSAANAKYREKIITVTGRVSETELPNDATVNIKISDSTGSYVIFSFTGNYLEPAKKLMVNDSVVIKGSCSGGIYSDILETETITFKRCALLNK
jgi:hypothetical protein